MFEKQTLDLLHAPLDKKLVKQRKGSGSMMLDYIEGWAAIARANEVFNFDWSRETDFPHLVQEIQDEEQKWKVSYTCRVTVKANGVTRQGIGYGTGKDRDLGAAHESAIKEAETDATKRALMTFGWSFGLALYDKDRTHVASDGEPQKAAQAPTQPNGGHDLATVTAGEWWAKNRTKAEFAAFQKSCKDIGESWVPITLLCIEMDKKPEDHIMELSATKETAAA